MHGHERDVQVGATGHAGGEVLPLGWAQANRAWTVGSGAVGDGPSVQGLYAKLEPLQEQGDALCDWNPSGQEHALQEHGGGVTQLSCDCPPGHSRQGDGIRARLWHASQLCQGSQECVLRLARTARAGQARCRDLGEARQIGCHAGRSAAMQWRSGLGIGLAAGVGCVGSGCLGTSSR